MTHDTDQTMNHPTPSTRTCQPLTGTEAAYILCDSAGHQLSLGRYAVAGRLYAQALTLLETDAGPGHPDIAGVLNHLSELEQLRGNLEEAEQLARRSLGILEALVDREGVVLPHVGDVDADTATALVDVYCDAMNQLATALRARGLYDEAESPYLHALGLLERTFGPHSTEVGDALNALAVLYKYRGEYDRAESLYQRARKIAEAAGDDELLSSVLYNLAGLAHGRGRYAEGEPLARRALELAQELMGEDHPRTAVHMSTLAAILDGLGKYGESEPLYRKALSIYRTVFGPRHPDVALNLNNLAAIARERGDHAEAERLYRQALEIREEALGPCHPQVGTSLHNLGMLYLTQGRYADAATCLDRALSILEQACGSDHPHTIACRGGQLDVQRILAAARE